MMKKLISILLCLSYLNSSIVKAAPIDDFENQVNQAIEDYRQTIEQFLALEKSRIAPTHVTQGITNAFALTQSGIDLHIKGMNSDFITIAEESKNLNSHLEAIRTAANSVTIDGYQILLSHKYAAEVSIARIRSLHESIQGRLKAAEALMKGKNGFCENLSKRLDPEKISLDSASEIVSRIPIPPYQGIDPKAFFSQSPTARGAAILSGTATFIAGVFLYSVIQDVSIMAAANSLFAFTIEGGNILLAGNGWGAVIEGGATQVVIDKNVSVHRIVDLRTGEIVFQR